MSFEAPDISFWFQTLGGQHTLEDKARLRARHWRSSTMDSPLFEVLELLVLLSVPLSSSALQSFGIRQRDINFAAATDKRSGN
jgi:hypothetical protein